jgi:hypothetical protein
MTDLSETHVVVAIAMDNLSLSPCKRVDWGLTSMWGLPSRLLLLYDDRRSTT